MSPTIPQSEGERAMTDYHPDSQIGKDIAELKPRILRAAGELTGVVRPQPAYYTPSERMEEFAHIYAIRVGDGHDEDLDAVIHLYRAWQADPESRDAREALTEAVEIAIENAEAAQATGAAR